MAFRYPQKKQTLILRKNVKQESRSWANSEEEIKEQPKAKPDTDLPSFNSDE